MITTAWIRPLGQPGGAAADLGGKGESLTRLAAAGFPVPDGFCVTTAAYQAYLQHHDLAAALAARTNTVRRELLRFASNPGVWLPERLPAPSSLRTRDKG